MMQTGCATLLALIVLIVSVLIPHMSRSEIQSALGVALPADATNIRFETRAEFMTVTHWLRFDSRDANQYLENFELNSALESRLNPFAENDYQVPWWWDAADQQSVRGGVYERRGDALPQGIIIFIVSELEGGMFRVYMMVIDDV